MILLLLTIEWAWNRSETGRFLRDCDAMTVQSVICKAIGLMERGIGEVVGETLIQAVPVFTTEENNGWLEQGLKRMKGG